MAHKPDHPHDPSPAIQSAEAHTDHVEHPEWPIYWKVGLFLTIITVVEVWAYYIPSFVASKLFVPSLLIMSAVKFATVVAFYMHLRYDHKLFRAIFTGPLLIAMATLVGLLFLFSKISV
jgi:cytochrome c oxidase subunit 4